MPNGGTDCCMNCRHNKANQQSHDVKSVMRDTRLTYCTMHNVPIRSRAWTFCRNISNETPDPLIPIAASGRFEGWYTRIPWYGLVAPQVDVPVEACDICGNSQEKGIILDFKTLHPALQFCCNDHYKEWFEKNTQLPLFEIAKNLGRTSLHEEIFESPLISFQDDLNEKIDTPDLAGWTPLHLASYLGRSEAVSQLLDAGADVSRTIDLGLNAIDLAASEGHFEIVGQLIPLIYSDQTSLNVALLQAASSGWIGLVEQLLEAGADIEAVDYRGRTPLLLAVWQGHYNVSVFLLDHGANGAVEDDYGNTPLKTVDTWTAQSSSDLRELIHAWVEANSKGHKS